MFSVRRNQVIITALVVMIAVAGYLNYTDGLQKNNQQTKIALDDNGEISALVPNGYGYADTYGEIGDALTMEDDDPSIAMEAPMATTVLNTGSGNEVDAGEAVFVNRSMDSSYFVQAKLEREQARSKQKDLIMGMISDDKLDKDSKAICANAMLEIQQRIEKETAAEAMIEAKGFKEVYVRIDDKTVDVVVNKEALSDAEIAQIEDIIKRKTGMSSDQIRISPMRK